jgi:hypothetical protein
MSLATHAHAHTTGGATPPRCTDATNSDTPKRQYYVLCTRRQRRRREGGGTAQRPATAKQPHLQNVEAQLQVVQHDVIEEPNACNLTIKT